MEDDFSEAQLFFDAVREVAGEDGVLALRRHLGGSEMDVPGCRVTEGSGLATALGFAAACKVVDKLRVLGADDRPAAGFRVYVAQEQFGIRQRARAMALDALRAGMTPREAAQHVGVTERTIYNIVRRYRRATGQADAFLSHHVKVARDRDAAIIAAHAQGPTIAEMTARLDIRPATLDARLKRARARTGLPLDLHRPERTRGSTEPVPPGRLRVDRHVEQVATPRRSAEGVNWAERKAQLIAAYAEGLTPDAIAQRFGWAVSYIYSQFWWVRQETGLPLRFDRAPGQEKVWGEHVRERKLQVERCFHEGLSAQKTAGRLGISVSSVRNYINKLRRDTGRPFIFEGSREHANTRLGEDRRSAIFSAYAPGMTLDALSDRAGLTERVVQIHLARLRRETGRTLPLQRRPHLAEGRPRP